MSKEVGPYLDRNGMYYVSWTSNAGEFWERWFHTLTIANKWLAEMKAYHP